MPVQIPALPVMTSAEGEATITDARVLLGHLNGESLLAGRLPIKKRKFPGGSAETGGADRHGTSGDGKGASSQ